MKQRALGASGIDVSVLGLGTVKIGRNQQVKYPSEFEIPDDKQVQALFEQAQSAGINFFDTAPAYGNSEQRIGKLLPSRHDCVIMTKVGEIFEHGESKFDFSYNHTRMSVEQSLRHLRRDMVDVVLVHSDGNDMGIIHNEGVFDALEKLKQQGLIRAFGMSTKTLEGGLWVVDHCDVVMATFNLEVDSDRPVIEYAHQMNKGVVVKKGLQSGHAQNVDSAFDYVLSQPGVNSMIVGTINPQHLRSNVERVNSLFSGLASE